MESEELLPAIKSMIEAQNWQGYLQVRRAYIKNGGKQGAIARMIRSLPDEQQIAYGRYFKTYENVSLPVRKLLIEEDQLKESQRQAAYEERKMAELAAWSKPIKRDRSGGDTQ